MSSRAVTAAIVLAAALLPAWTAAQKVTYDYDKAANFAGYKTYAHKAGTAVGQELIDARIVAAIDAELAAKGFTKVESNPDVFVAPVARCSFESEPQPLPSAATAAAPPASRRNCRLSSRSPPTTPPPGDRPPPRRW